MDVLTFLRLKAPVKRFHEKKKILQDLSNFGEDEEGEGMSFPLFLGR